MSDDISIHRNSSNVLWAIVTAVAAFVGSTGSALLVGAMNHSMEFQNQSRLACIARQDKFEEMFRERVDEFVASEVKFKNSMRTAKPKIDEIQPKIADMRTASARLSAVSNELLSNSTKLLTVTASQLVDALESKSEKASSLIIRMEELDQKWWMLLSRMDDEMLRHWQSCSS